MELTPQQQKDLWGEHGPYSEVRLHSNVQLLDLSQSYPLIEVIAFINPLTFKVIKQNIKLFSKDKMVEYLIANSIYGSKNHGYEVCVYSCKYLDDEVVCKARLYLEEARDAILRMHNFTMELLEIEGGCGKTPHLE